MGRSMRSRLLLVLAILLPRLVLADDTTGDAPVFSCNRHVGEVVVTFRPETAVKDLVTWTMGFTCKQFLYETRFVENRKLTVMAPEKMSPDEAYQLFLASLSTVGLAVVPYGHALRIVEAQTVKRESLPIVDKPGNVEQVVRFVLRPTYSKPEMLASAFDGLRSDAGDIKAVGSLLLITDYASHVHDMVELAKLIDVPGGNDGIYTIPVVHADATRLQAKLQEVLGVSPGTPSKPGDVSTKVLVDERTNALIVAGPTSSYEHVRALVARLDVPIDMEGGASIHVFQLGNAIAEEVAKTLNEAIQRQPSAGATTTGRPSTAPTAASPSPGDTMTLQGSVRVIADAKTNKLIVTATGHDYLAVRDVIEQLDQPRKQVFIETVVLDVQLSDGVSAGTSSHGVLPAQNGSAIVLGGVETGGVNTLDLKDTLGAATGLITGIVGSSTTSFLGTSIPSYALLFEALASTSSSNVISTPSIIALDNEDAKFHVGTNVPYQKGVVPISAGNPLTGTTTNIEREDLNFELDIKPHISTNDNVLLEIKNDAKDLGSSDPLLGPTWNTRGFETRVVVHDQQTIVLNGMTQESEVEGTSKVPILGDIPILGYAFKYKTRTKKRSNVLILMTPYIVKDQLELQAIQERKLREHDEFVASFHVLDHMPYVPKTDYRHKRGVVEEINRAVEVVEEDRRARDELPSASRVVEGPVR